DWSWMVAGVLYIGWMLSYWVNLGILEDGRDWIYLAMFAIFANDTGAFFIGTKWGKHKLASDISPGKTWEGAIGGLLSAVVGAIAISRIPILFSSSPIEYWQVVLLGCLISLFAQLGDLVESLLKRNMGLKESGNLLPGHGGVLDRFDSFIFVGAVVYYYIWMVV
ncbi:MAG TPA: CDP-archaeol synthase, partial [Dehalococcoidia bacterium]|nr:CDP-archaeol synthase [Dehalococcoidia bacterium]